MLYAGNRIRLFRLMEGYTQVQMADLLGMPQRRYARMETVRVSAHYRESIKDFATLMGIRSKYLIDGTPPARETGYLYYELPSPKIVGFMPRIKGKILTDVSNAIHMFLGEVLYEHSTKGYRVGEMSSNDMYFVYQISPQATLVLRAHGRYIGDLEEVARKYNLTLEELVTIKDADNVDIVDGKKEIEKVIELHRRIGIPKLAVFYDQVKGISAEMKLADERAREQAMRRLCIALLDLGVDPADVFAELERLQKEREGGND